MSEAKMKQQLKIAAWNCRGIVNKIDELLDFVIRENIDVVLLSETFLSSNNSLKKCGFIIHRNDRTVSHGGGVAIIIRNNIPHCKVNLSLTNSLEVVAIKLKIKGVFHTIISAYKPPKNKLCIKDLNYLTSLDRNVLIAGDLNCKDQLWFCSRGNSNGKILNNYSIKKDIRILFPDSPTYFPPKGIPSILDLAVVKGCVSMTQPETIHSLSSDHLPIIFEIGGTIEVNNKTYRDFSKADWKLFKQYINQNINLNTSINSIQSINEQITNLTKLIQIATSSSIPTKTVNTIYKYKLPSAILELINLKNRLYRQWRKHKISSLKTVVNSLILDIKNKINSHKNDTWEGKLKSLKTQDNSLWKLTKTLKNKNTGIPPLRKSNQNNHSNFTRNNFEKAELIAHTFAKSHTLTLNQTNQYVEEIVKESINNLNNTVVRSTDIDLIAPSEIIEIIKHFKNKKAPGQDDINNTLLKNLPRKALVLLTKIFNACLITGYFPDCWKKAKIIPIPKPGKDKTSPNSYRPISLLPCLSKILEKLILTRLRPTLDKNVPNEQFGFRNKHCTSSQLTRLAQHIRGNFNIKKSTGMLLLDFSKAFDVVWHEGLIHKLIKISTPTYITRIIQSYLTNRAFAVHINNVSSNTFPIPAGVPQGSILSPNLFNLFLCDLPSFPDCQMALYADDTAIFTSSFRLDTIRRRLQSSISLLTNYYARWKLQLNESKTEAIMFTNKRKIKQISPIIINKSKIPWLPEVKYLGLILDSKLNWSKHIKHITNKCNNAICLLYPIINRKSKLTSKNKLLLYKTILRPLITYGCAAWSPLTKTNFRKLQIIQNKCLKMAFDLPPGTYLEDFQKFIKLSSIEELITKLNNNHYHKMLTNKTNPLLFNVNKTKYISKKRNFKLPIAANFKF
jgi:Reverse transcriptase (RNA-dependent DNA polymerase)/Endonuclease-reverse transcriptase